MNGAIRVDAVVMPTEKARSPWQRKLMMLDETPPGTQPTRIRPTARSEGRLKILVIIQARKGMMVNCPIAPTKISNGRFARMTKSCFPRVRPMESIITPRITV